MDPVVPLEDHNVVDVAQFRALLRLIPAERIAHMIEVATTMRSLAEPARAV